MSIRAFAFDLDETLVDAEDQHVEATRAMLDATGIDPAKVRDVFHDVTGARTRDLVEAYRAASGVAHTLDELLALRHSAFLAALDRHPPAPRPGARACVEACRALGPVALVTSGHREDALATLDALGLTALFSAVVTGDDVHEPKPAPEPYLVAASRLGVRPQEMLVFEDSPRGVRAARAAGCVAVAVPNARSTKPDAVAMAHLVLGSLDDALPLDALFARLAA